MELLAERGVNHIDTAASYGDAEIRLGAWLRHHREEVFLATKTEERTYRGAREELRRSLGRMNVDDVDLWQMHVLIDSDDWETTMGPGGALEAFIEARDEGLVRFFGVTGHGLSAPAMHLKSLERFDFDAVIVPWNWTMSRIPAYREDFLRLRDVCRERGVAFQLIKTVCRRPKREEEADRWDCWYEPLENPEDIAAAIGFAMSIDEAFINTVGDVRVLPKILDAIAEYETPPDEAEMARRAAAGEWEPLFA
jgi:aryl-alcohol dehydrogenase-like predicted oxidoreductase